MEQIKTYEIEWVNVEEIKLDDSNPNEMDNLKLDALRKIMKDKGMLQPILVDQNSLMCDGEHRYKIFKEFGMQKIPCYRLNLTDNERRLLRQTMNKVRGTHNPREDIEDLIRISKEIGVSELSKNLGIEEKNLGDYINSVNLVPESFLEIQAMEREKVKMLKMVTIKLTDDQAKKIMENLEGLDFGQWVLVPIGGLLVDNIGN